MAKVVFYEKPGCAGNARQKALLRQSGHELEVRNLLDAPWTRDSLRAFFGDRPVAEWFNRNSPRVKSGDVRPEALDDAAALSLMLADPLLVRRPLMQVDGRCEAGFEAARVAAWIGLRADAPSADETCQRNAAEGCRGHPAGESGRP